MAYTVQDISIDMAGQLSYAMCQSNSPGNILGIIYRECMFGPVMRCQLIMMCQSSTPHDELLAYGSKPCIA
jgi:hypothetical protein